MITKNSFEFYYTATPTNKHHGVGIVATKDVKVEYETITDRTCKVTFKLQKRKVIFISTYAPTLEVSEKENNIRDEYYAALDDTITKVNNKDILIISGDMNAETGTGHANYPECVGRYGKGEINSN